VTFKPQPVRVKSPSGQEYDVEWPSDDVKQILLIHFVEWYICFLVGKRTRRFKCF
jgi:hypothetical protein